VPGQGEAGHRSGNVRLTVRLLGQATASQDRRVTTASRPGPLELGRCGVTYASQIRPVD
jgi:hypothetical protein